MKRILTFIALFLIVVSCDKEVEKLEFTSSEMTAEDLPTCKKDICPKIDMQLVKAQGKSPLADTVNEAVAQVVTSSLSVDPDEEKKIKTLDEGLANFISVYRDYKADFPQSPEDYEVKMTSKVSHQDENLISIAIDAYTYWGGAHGYGSKRYLNFDVQTGGQLDKETLIKDKPGFLAYAENKFREQQDIPNDGNINDTGYMFENDTFSLPENIGFDGDDVILVYNPYEVAAYAEGQIVVRIPVEEVKDYLAVEI